MAGPEAPGSADAGGAIQVLQELVGGQLDRLVPPLGGAVVAGDDAAAVDPSKVAHHECVSALRLVRGVIGQAEVPVGVVVPGV